MWPLARRHPGADPTALGDALDAVERAYGRVVVDSPAGLRADAGLPLFVADACLLVTTPSRPALADGLRVRALARRFDAGLVRVALNRAGPDPPADRVANLFGAPVVSIPEDAAVAEAQAAGKSVAVRAPDSVAAARLRALSTAVQSLSSW